MKNLSCHYCGYHNRHYKYIANFNATHIFQRFFTDFLLFHTFNISKMIVSICILGLISIRFYRKFTTYLILTSSINGYISIDLKNKIFVKHFANSFIFRNFAN